jgi:hypothetical protein
MLWEPVRNENRRRYSEAMYRIFDALKKVCENNIEKMSTFIRVVLVIFDINQEIG